MATHFWAEGVWMCRWRRGQQKVWRKQLIEVQTWRHERGLAGAVVCDTRDLGIMLPQCTPCFSSPQDVKNMLLKQAKLVYWKKWAAKRGCGELKRVWLEPIRALLRRKTNEARTDRHRNVMKKLVVEGGWVQQRMYDIGWSGETRCRGCHEEESMEKHRLYHCPSWREARNQIPEGVEK